MKRLAISGFVALGAAYVLGGGGQIPVSTSSIQQAAIPPEAATYQLAPPLPPAPALSIGKPENAVIILVDDLSVADSAFMPEGSARHYMPTIDRLASQSLVFDNLHTVTPICTPSRFSLLTGSYPSRSQASYQTWRLGYEGAEVPEFTSQITPRDMTLPRRLQFLGFRTGFAGKDHVVEHKDYRLSYTTPSTASLADADIMTKLQLDRDAAVQGLRNIGFDEVYSVFPTNPAELPVKELQAHNLDWIVDGAKKFIDNNYRSKFFLVVSLTVPHFPLNPARSWNADPRSTPFGFLDRAPNVMPARSTLTTRVNAAGFPGDENYLWLDDAVKAVLDSLDSRGVRDKTAIFFLSDHGMAGKGSIYRSASHTSGFVRYLGFSGHTSALLANIDIQPTILNMFGAPPAGDGVSMLPVLGGTANQVRDHVYLELGYARSILTDKWQYIAVRHTDFIRQQAALKSFPLAHWPNHGGLHSLEKEAMPLFPSYLALDQLYDVRADPKEQSNLYGQPTYVPVSSQLRTLLQTEAAKTPGVFRVY